MAGVFYLRSVWNNGEGVLDVRVSYETAEKMAYALVRAMNSARAENYSLGESLREYFFEEAGDGDSRCTVDEFVAQEPGTPVCDEFEVVVDEDDRIHFCPFEWQTVMSAEEWSAVSSLWRPWLANAPLDDDDRMGWQVCLTKAEFLGQPG